MDVTDDDFLRLSSLLIGLGYADPLDGPGYQRSAIELAVLGKIAGGIPLAPMSWDSLRDMLTDEQAEKLLATLIARVDMLAKI